ncbi:hypothetical protein AALP_AAs60501U000100 [Arabis alpina]|uniref:MATH domain-containing protein n=1 Tax=Arabis alpina TaxID=50452 RepID=A0A087G273_ARAAL|nr:hypothetical protein AALP_AAs60501U000100 [Arabis alpina]
MGGSYSPVVPVSKIVQNWREHPPSSYSLKIHNFSQLENSTAYSDRKYQSRFFSSGGFNWRLVVYPKGNEKDNGNGFISMYVEIDNNSLMVFTPPTEVFAEIRFFVYNKKQNKYFTMQDVEVKRFNALRTVWGLPQVLSSVTNWEILSLNEKLRDPKFTWNVKNFSSLKENFYISNIFWIGGRKWVLKLYPNGESTSYGKWLSFFLHLAPKETLKADEKIYVQGYLRVLNPLGSNHSTHRLTHWQTASNQGWGWPQFVSLAAVRKVN